MPLTFSEGAMTASGNLVIHELQHAVYKYVTCTRCGVEYQRVKLDGEKEFSERPCPKCGSVHIHLRATPTGLRVSGSDIDPDSVAV